MDSFDGSTNRESNRSVSDLYDDLERVLGHVRPKRQAELLESLKMSELVNDLRKAIIDSGLKHYAIGKVSSVSASVIDRFVSGERDIRLETAGRIADALGYSLVESETNEPAKLAAKKSAKRKPSKRTLKRDL